MFDTSEFNFSFRPDISLPDNDGKFWIENDDEELEELEGTHLQPGTGSDGKERIIYQGEVEVANLSLESTLSDVLWITMHRDGNDYRLVTRSEMPEYDEFQATKPQFNDVPTFGELLFALDQLASEYSDDAPVGWVQGIIPEVTVSTIGSELYPQLEKWYFGVQDHFFTIGELIYLDDPTGKSFRKVKYAEPQPERLKEKAPGSGSFFAAPRENPS